ncbi:hypothetical protein KY332_03835 [Candidatus Woesearchaeota archaeon]|nr:hypothetical protein [Candidatus Woesearchaeota archaeon]
MESTSQTIRFFYIETPKFEKILRQKAAEQGISFTTEYIPPQPLQTWKERKFAYAFAMELGLKNEYFAPFRINNRPTLEERAVVKDWLDKLKKYKPVSYEMHDKFYTITTEHEENPLYEEEVTAAEGLVRKIFDLTEERMEDIKDIVNHVKYDGKYRNTLILK